MKTIISIAGMKDIPSDETLERDLYFVPVVGDMIWLDDEEYEIEESFLVLVRAIGGDNNILLYVISEDHPMCPDQPMAPKALDKLWWKIASIEEERYKVAHNIKD